MRRFAIQLAGLGLFLFIPLVLFLFVRHPRPVGLSLAVGIVLMIGHRFLARPYMERVRQLKCIWCNRVLSSEAPSETVAIGTDSGPVEFVACRGHAAPAERFFAWVDRLRLLLRLGIGVPLVALLALLAIAATGAVDATGIATDAFRLVIGLTVNLAALGPFVGSGVGTPRAAFPLHNFTLLGVRAILWIFRLIGIWWIWEGARGLLRALS